MMRGSNCCFCLTIKEKFILRLVYKEEEKEKVAGPFGLQAHLEPKLLTRVIPPILN